MLQKTKEQWVKEAITDYKAERYEKSLAACEQAIQVDPQYTNAHNGKGLSLNGLALYEKALLAFEQALQLDPHYARAYAGKGLSLR